ncbi:hypothetical protein [Burkholderia sp. BCC1998]|uniref:hypothetical protein n=1 Tax=Burkholderia sp. BCC1998 TaxID=2817447 RepID=UPI002AB7E76D|nr:hypothetical protein [Burkholderia sp. BCC1998]
MKIRTAIGVAVTTFLAACGGGDGGGSGSTSAPVQNQDSQGFWQGTTSNGRNVSALVLETGQYFAVYSTNDVVDGMFEGTFSTSGNTITDKSSLDFAIGVGVIPASITGSVTTKQSINGTVSESNNSVTFSGNYNAAYDTPATLSQAVGTWSGHSSGTTVATSLTVTSTGSFTGTSGTCTFSGSVAPRATGKAVFDGTVTFNDASCQLGAGASLGFEAVVSGTQLIAAGINSSRTNGFIFIGAKS